MVQRPRAAAVAAALVLSIMLPAVAAPGVASAANPAPDPPLPIASTISGHALGIDGGSLAGGIVTACSLTVPFCNSDTISPTARYAITVPAGDTYRVAIDPPFPYLAGYYSAPALSAFTQDVSLASPILVVGDVSLRGMIVPFGPVPPPGTGAITGYVVGIDAGSLAGGRVTACSAVWWCASGTIQLDGSYQIGVLPPGAYTLAIQPSLGSPYPSGYYASWAPGNFTTSISSATAVGVAYGVTVVPTVVVPLSGPVPSVGSISGSVVGSGGASLAGGTVTACSTAYACTRASIGSGGAYWIGYLPAGNYTVSVTPPSSSWLTGFYSASAPGYFTTSAAAATVITVWNSNVALPTIVVPWAVTYGALSGYVQGLTPGALAGGTVTACNAAAACATTTIGSDGAYWLGSLPSGSYTVKIVPVASSGYPTGYYAAGGTGHFTVSASSATVVSVAGATVTLPTIVVPWTGSGTGGIVVGPPKAYVVWAFLRPEFTDGTTTSLRIAEGERAELASYIDPQLAGMRVEVWRRLKGKSWVMITTRGISGAGWVIYRFTATAGTNDAQYRFHLPATPMTISVWSVARTVRLL